MEKFNIVLDKNGRRRYWSMYGDFNFNQNLAMEFSRSAAGLRLEVILSTAKHPQYSEWQGAKVISVVQQELVTY